MRQGAGMMGKIARDLEIDNNLFIKMLQLLVFQKLTSKALQTVRDEVPNICFTENFMKSLPKYQIPPSSIWKT